MFRKITTGSIMSTLLAGVAIFGVMYSCSNAESSKQKNASPTKNSTSKSLVKENATATTAQVSTETSTVSPKEDRQLVVYYFMTAYRCPSCHFIEETTKAAINDNFAEELKSGRVVFKMINVEESTYSHFATDYKLYTKSVVLSDLNRGKETRWANLDKVWKLIGKDQEFKNYIVKEVKDYLGA